MNWYKQAARSIHREKLKAVLERYYRKLLEEKGMSLEDVPDDAVLIEQDDGDWGVEGTLGPERRRIINPEMTEEHAVGRAVDNLMFRQRLMRG